MRGKGSPRGRDAFIGLSSPTSNARRPLGAAGVPLDQHIDPGGHDHAAGRQAAQELRLVGVGCRSPRRHPAAGASSPSLTEAVGDTVSLDLAGLVENTSNVSTTFTRSPRSNGNGSVMNAYSARASGRRVRSRCTAAAPSTSGQNERCRSTARGRSPEQRGQVGTWRPRVPRAPRRRRPCDATRCRPGCRSRRSRYAPAVAGAAPGSDRSTGEATEVPTPRRRAIASRRWMRTSRCPRVLGEGNTWVTQIARRPAPSAPRRGRRGHVGSAEVNVGLPGRTRQRADRDR